MMQFRADLHIHSCLSPCGSLDMSPRRIARESARRGISMAALCDHNSALNCPAFAEACADEGITAIFGLEVTTREEVHVLVLFREVEAALQIGRYLYGRLTGGPYDVEMFGDQVYVNSDEQILGGVEKHLIAAVDLSFEEVGRLAHDSGGLFIPAHVDRAVYSVRSQLGFLPPGEYDAVEIVRDPCPVDTLGCARIASSDAHFPDDIGARYTLFQAGECSFDGLRQALRDGRTTACCQSPREQV